MTATLEKTDEITIEELEGAIRAYQMFYDMETDQLLEWIAINDPRLETIEDAGFWRSDWELLQRLKKRPSQPDVDDEDPKRVLLLLCHSTWKNMRKKSRALSEQSRLVLTRSQS
jgi:hypothetical protein